ncbi:helix-turn-helix domain-containing protein [Desulfobacterota bacterium M19]
MRARKPRLHYPGACYHVILRGNRGDAQRARHHKKTARKATLEQVLEAVCKHYAIKQTALASGSREKRLTEPRALAALLVRETDYLSLMNFSRKLKRDLPELSQSASRLEKKLEKDTHLSSLPPPLPVTLRHENLLR